MNDKAKWDPQAVQGIIASLQHKPGALLPILHGIQNALGYIPPDSVPMIADAIQQTRAEVHGVITFYHHFRLTPPGRIKLEVCRAEACQARGSRDLEFHVKEKLGIDYHQTTLDREFSLEPVYCLGNCACGPTIRVDDDIIGRITPEKFDLLVDELTTTALEIR
ncbi:formate dehydrogenase subunit gamma [Neptunomonas japonica]|uniref:NADH-quinone oxidoreductase subunit E n=1 Tax=Neptunomonas japonica JAMM 1380 TaxID=1441457 RepID=A0A7R6PC68_9GAMM|nr:formate dehydrogenase subunit gamma [Neptunomonas japonica]BBB29814.1 formate dehydrogenase, gamma subunit [Neptunomonas japonica JAMM 1380]